MVISSNANYGIKINSGESSNFAIDYQNDGLTEEDRRVRTILKEHYDKVYKENLTHSDPIAYIESKYCDVTSPNFCAHMTEDQRSIAYRNEKRMIETGGKNTAGFGRYDYALRNYPDLYIGGSSQIGYSRDTDKEKFHGRCIINEQIAKLLSGHGITIDEDTDLCFTIDPYYFKLSVSGNMSRDKLGLIEKLLNQDENAKKIWTHAWDCMHNAENEIINNQGNKTKAQQFSLWHEFYNTTGYDLQKVECSNGVYLMPDGVDILSLFKEKETNADGFELFSNRLKQMIQKTWNTRDDLILKIGYNRNGLYDIGQEHGYGISQSNWITNKNTSIFDAKV